MSCKNNDTIQFPKNIRYPEEQLAVWEWQSDFQQPVCPIEKFGKYTTVPDFYTSQFSFVQEEAGLELMGAIMAGDRYDLADALADSLFTALGLLNVIGAPCPAVVPLNFDKIAPMQTVEIILRKLATCKMSQDVLDFTGDLVTCLEKISEDEGIPLIPCFNEVVRSNNTKLWQTDEVDEAKEKTEFDGWSFTRVSSNGWIAKDPSGKVKKSPSYSPPDFRSLFTPNEK